ncbi:MAG: PIN domain-containing protein [Actinobacteria bacterium]|nr:MAG: PIN domain-containing protein [Actinomycetota bacterium]
MTSRFLIDTNVLVYSIDPAEPVKRERAISVLDGLATPDAACVSTQSLGEFFRVSTVRVANPLSEDEAAGYLREWQEAWPVLGTSALTLIEQVRGRLRHRMSWWDAQQWAIARVNHVPMILSEDFTDGQTIEGVTFVDPFADGFDVGALAE